MTSDAHQGRNGPLSGHLVVAMEHSVAGPLCSRILHEMGAEVIKVERPPLGDFSRRWDTNAGGEGAQFWWLNRGKRSLALDLKTEAGQRQLHELLDRSSVFLQNLSPASAARLHVGAQELSTRFPRLVSCHISGYGATGSFSDRKAYDMLIQAEAGVMSLTGLPEQPMRVGVSIADVATGLYSAVAVLGGVLAREKTGVGTTIDMAMFDVAAEFLGPMLISFMNSGIEYERSPDQHHAIAPYGVFTCADGAKVLLAVEHDEEWVNFCRDVMQAPELARDASYLTNVQRVASRERLLQLISQVVCRLTSAELIRRLDTARIAYARLNSAGEVAHHSVMTQRGGTATSKNKEGIDVQHLVGLIDRIFGGTLGARQRPPGLGEDNHNAYAAAADH